MPFNDGTKRIAALYAFVDQFIAGDNAMRSSFDQVFGDLVNSVNELAEYLEASATAGTDQRYMGRLVAVPTTRLDSAPLEEGDFYVAAHADAGRVGLVYVYNGSTFVVSSDFTTIGSWFKDTLSAAASQAAGRTALGLGTAATQNTTAFAAASVETDVAMALKLLASGIAKSMTSNDWNNAHLAGPGTTMVQANAAATNAPVALNAAGLYVAYDANNGFLIAAAHGSATIYYRMRVADAWGAWQSLASAQSLSSLALVAGDILYATGPNMFARLAKGTGGQALLMNAGATAPEWGANGLQWQAAVATTSGDDLSLSAAIPATASRLVVSFRGVSINGTNDILVQLGTSGGFVITGYVSSCGLAGPSTSGGLSTAGILVFSGSAGRTISGSVTLDKVSGNLWSATVCCSDGIENIIAGGGYVDLGGVATQIRISTSGANTFDAGAASVGWQ